MHARQLYILVHHHNFNRAMYICNKNYLLCFVDLCYKVAVSFFGFVEYSFVECSFSKYFFFNKLLKLVYPVKSNFIMQTLNNQRKITIF